MKPITLISITFFWTLALSKNEKFDISLELPVLQRDEHLSLGSIKTKVGY